MIAPPSPHAPSRVLMTADTVGGVWTYTLELVRALSVHGVRVDLATMGAPLSADQRVAAAAVPHLEVFEREFKLEWMHDPWDDVARAGEWLLDLEHERRPDVIHLNQYSFGALPWRAPVIMVGHSCVLSWWEAVHGGPAPPVWRRYRDTVTRGIAGADLVVAPTHTMLRSLTRYYGPLHAGAVIHNGRDSQRFPVAPKEPLVLTAGRVWDEAKNVAALDAVAPDIPWPVYVAGEDRHPDGTRLQLETAESLGRLSHDALAGWLGRASIFVLLAWYEPFGLSAVEAALAGCALVLGDIPSLRELWDGVAVFVAPDEPDTLRDALRLLIDDARLRQTLAMRARRRALQFTPERMARGYVRSYAGLIAGGGTTTRRPGVPACAS